MRKYIYYINPIKCPGVAAFCERSGGGVGIVWCKRAVNQPLSKKLLINSIKVMSSLSEAPTLLFLLPLLSSDKLRKNFFLDEQVLSF